MPPRAPLFWWKPRGLLSRLLWPVAAFYGAIAGWRMRRSGQAARIPVICIGNFTLGGSGKTPTVIALAQWLKKTGETPFVLSRGYGGRRKGPLRVEAKNHRAADVGDEPLLIARHAPVIVARDRVMGAALAHDQGASLIVMDDGLQNPSLKKDIVVAVVDGRRGLGNTCVFPAGPLRAPLAAQLEHIDAILVIGTGEGAARITAIAGAHALPLFHARLEPDADALRAIGKARLLAFAGIGDPEKFFATLEDAGLTVAAREGFADHHPYSEADATRLLAQAERDKLLPLTTEKDRARLEGQTGALARLHERAKDLPVRLVIENEEALRGLLRRVLDKKR